LLASIVGQQTAEAMHDGFHQEASQWVTAQGPRYTGVMSVRRDDDSVSIPATPDCLQHPTNKTQWLIITRSGPNLDAMDWTELGTAVNCDSPVQYQWFWGYGWQGNWYLRGTMPVRSLGQEHYFHVFRVNEVWYWDVDDIPVSPNPSMYWNAIGTEARIGLESYNHGSSVSSYYVHTMQNTLSEGPWTAFLYAAAGTSGGPPPTCMGAYRASDTEVYLWKYAC